MVTPIEGVTSQSDAQNVPQSAFAAVAAKASAVQVQVGSAVGAASASDVKVTSLQQLQTDPRLKAVYKAITEGIAQSIITSAQHSEDELEKTIREARDRDGGG